MWLEGGPPLGFLFLTSPAAFLLGLPLLVFKDLFGFDHGLRNDFSGKFKRVRQAGEGGSAFPICEMTPAEGINSSCGFSRVFVAEAKPERMAIEVKLFQPGLNERREREIDCS